VAAPERRPRGFLITGGSRGLGLAFCRHYLKSGHAVVTCARTTTPEADELMAQYHDRFRILELDLAEEHAPRRLVHEAAAALGAIDVLVNNAAVGQDSLLAHTSDAAIARIVKVNLIATIQLVRLVVRRMMLDGRGIILNVSSTCATRGYPGLAAYAATKGGLEALTRSLARELGGHGILINCVAPGFFESEMSGVLSPSQIDAIRRRTPTGGLATPAQVVRAADALVSEGANITGQVLVVDGGASIA
jgi:3-oxoacyl-[acyl-carrier protein] reductase